MIGIVLGDLNMQTGGITVTNTEGLYSAPTNRIQADRLADADGALIVKQQYDSKQITLEGWLRADTLAEFESLRDTFLAAISIKNQALDIDYGGSTRRWLVNYQNAVVAKRSNTSARFSLQLLSPDGMGWDLTSTALLSSENITTSPVDVAISVGGTYTCEPLITLTISTVTGGTSKTVTLRNGTSLRGIAITRTWTASDTLEVDVLKKTVFVNNVPVEFSGQFPTWAIGDGIIQYLDDFTTRNATLSMSHTQRWL